MDQKLEADNTDAANPHIGETVDKTKKTRKRMKDLRKKIKTQMEFYFSDSNLQKDRFLKKETEKTEDGYIDIELFLKFNKIRTLTEDAKVIARSLKKSTLLETNSEETKIRRCVPVQTLPHVDDRTVYVEHLPRNIDHEWVRNLFSQCGNVLYVSLPRFKSTGDLKGFGFVEFSSPEEVAKACEFLNNPPPMSGRTGKFPKWNKMLYQLTRKTEPDLTEDMETQEKAKEPIEEPVQKACKKSKRRRHRTSESSVDGSSDAVPHKRRKTESTETAEENDGKEDSKDCGKDQTTKEQGKLDETVSDGLKSEEEERKDSKKKKKAKKQRLSDSNKSFDEDSEQTDSSAVEKCERGKRKRTSESQENSAPPVKISKKEDVTTQENTRSGKKKRSRKKKKKNKEKDVPPPQLKVITKHEWLKLRHEYLCKQKANMATLKQTLKQQETQEHDGIKMEEGRKKTPNARPVIEFTPGVIVQVSSNNPMNRRSLKEKLPSDVNVAYYDIVDDSMSGHIRCQDEQSAKKISDFLLENYTFTTLAGDCEKKYWDKLTADRENKFSNKQRSKKRGSQKLIEKAHRHNTEIMENKKHIVFED